MIVAAWPGWRTIDLMQAKTARSGRGKVTVDPERPVAGTVRLMTDEPIVVRSLEGEPPLGERLSELVRRRPWIAPAALLAVVAAYLVLRRR
jgi:CBS domain-containing protein